VRRGILEPDLTMDSWGIEVSYLSPRKTSEAFWKVVKASTAERLSHNLISAQAWKEKVKQVIGEML
jgi:hypothetical protein